jgi:hypothetical protein
VELSQFVSEKHKEGDVFTIKKFETEKYKFLLEIDREAKKEK